MFQRLFSKLFPLPSFRAGTDYVHSYRQHTDARVRRNPREAVGGCWDEIGHLQLDFLKKEGLKPYHSFLDIGCGTGRAGRLLIHYLDPGCYAGTDMSAACLKAFRKLLKSEKLHSKAPKLVYVPDGNMRFERLWKYDFILAQSVFTHLPEEMIAECFAEIHKVMKGKFYFTYLDPAEFKATEKEFTYPLAFFQQLAGRCHLSVEDISERYAHPRGQRMACATPIGA